MKLKSFAHMNCALAQTMNVIGERWSILILRDAFLGVTRFDAFQKNLGIARNILATRLKQLTDEGVLEKVPEEGGSRPAYRLTDKGYALIPVLIAMAHWGDEYKPHPKGARLTFVDRETGEPIERMSIRSADGKALSARDIEPVRGPALSK